MKTLTLELDEPTYEALMARARRTGRSEDEVIREALQPLRALQEFSERPKTGHSLRDFKPLGVTLLPGALNFDNLFDEMTDDADRD